MNMQAQLKAAMETAVANNAGGPAIAQIEQTQPLTNDEKTFVHKYEAAHTVIQQDKQDKASDMAINEALLDTPVNVLPDKPKLKSISDKAMLFTLSQTKFNTNKRDVNKTNEYQAGTVTKKLFKGDNLVSKARSAHDEVYNYVKDNTLPWDVGVRLVNSMFFREFSTEVRRLITLADTAVATLTANWDATWRADYASIEAMGLATNNPHLANANDYPDDIALFYSNRTRIEPIANADAMDVRMGVTDEEIADYVASLEARDAECGKSVLNNLLKPMEASILSLSKPIEEVERFYPTVVTNLTDVASRMSRANISDDPNIAQCINDLSTLAGGLNVDLLSHNQTSRDVAVLTLQALATKFRGFL